MTCHACRTNSVRLSHSLFERRSSRSLSALPSFSFSARHKLCNAGIEFFVRHILELARLADLLAVNEHAQFFTEQLQRAVRNTSLVLVFALLFPGLAAHAPGLQRTLNVLD
jgi:hypothetical protein